MIVNNSLFVIAPYWDSGTWVFDDERVGLVREPFVSGVPDMIDHLVRDIPDAREGFRMIFSKTKYPGYGQSLSWRGTEDEGNWYQMDEEPLLSGWLCPALSLYFPQPPEKLYVSAEPLVQAVLSISKSGTDRDPRELLLWRAGAEFPGGRVVASSPIDRP